MESKQHLPANDRQAEDDQDSSAQGCAGRCCRCLRRVPIATLLAICIAVIGMVIYLGGLMKALKEINEISALNGILEFGHTVSGVILGLTVTISIVVLIANIYASVQSQANYVGDWAECCGITFISLWMVVVYILCLAWVILSMFMILPVIFSIMFKFLCENTFLEDMSKCIDLNAYGLANLLKRAGIDESIGHNGTVCGPKEIKIFCDQIGASSSPFLVSMIGAVISVLGTVHLLMCLSANFAYLRGHKNSNYRYPAFELKTSAAEA